MPKSNLMLEEKKETPSKNTSTSSVASASTGIKSGATQVSAKAQAVADKYGTQDSRYDMGNPEFAKTVNSYRDQQKQKTIDNLINYRAKVLNSKADVDGDRFEYAGELNKQIAHLQSGDATYSDFNKVRDFLADKFDNRKYDRDYTKATSLLNKSDEEIDSYIADMEARESDLSYGHYTDSLGEEGTIDEIKQVQKNIASARNLKEARKMFDAWEVNGNYTPFDVLTMNKDGKTVSYDWTDYDTQSKEIDDRIAELTKQMNESDDMIEKAKIMDDIVALQDESIIVADKKNYQDKLISQMLLDSYADTDDVNTFEEVTSLLASRDDNTIQRMGKAGYSALVGAVNTSMNVFDVCKDYLSHKLGSDALNFHPEQFDVNDGENFSTQLRNYEKRLNNESLYGASSTQEAIVKVTNSTVNQLARMPLGEFGSLFTMALQTGAEAYRENLEMGYDRNTALTSAVVNGIITYNVEQIGWQGLEKALNSGAMNYSVGQYLYSLLTNPISEGLEEGVEYIADTWADKLVHPDWIDENGQINGERMAQSLVETLNTSLDGEQIWDAMFLGYLGGFALDTIVATPGFIQSRKQFNAYTQVKANIQQMIQSGMLTQDEVEYYTNTLTAYDIALNAYKGRSFTSDSIQLFSDMVPPLTSVADAEMSLMDSMKPSAEMDAMLEVDTVNKMREAVGIMQQAQQNLLDHGVKMTVTEFAKLSPEERIRVMEEGEHIQATGSSYRFLKTLLDYKGANGEFNKKTGELYLNPTSDETVYVTMIHELTHSLEGSKVYSSIRNMLIDEVGGQEAWDNMVESKRAEYYKKLFDRRSRMGDAYKDFETGDEAQNQKAYELAQFEVVAEQMSKGRSAEAIIDKMAKYNKSAFYRMYDNIRSRFTNNANTKLETMFINAIRENDLSRQSSSQYSLSEDLPELHKDRAIEEFGITNDFAKAGYIMNDGRLLDFSGGQPTRMEDHRSISSVFDEELDTGTAYLTAFLNEGNIRILPETGGIDVSEVNEPTDFQYSKIRQFMNEDRDGWHTLDISGADGSTIASMEYPPRTSSQKVINDLTAFYKDGTIPQNNTINTGLFQYNSNEGTPQFSLASTFQAVGMEIAKVGDSVVAFDNGEQVNEVTAEMVMTSPMGNMLKISEQRGFITSEDVEKQASMYATMLNMVLKTQNPDLIWAIAGSIGYQPAPQNTKFDESAPTAHSAFTSNSDTQYGTTFDVTTICTKTQQLIDVASRVMVELDRGLTEEEIINIVYDEVNKAKQPVPCPVCYVFSRWVGSGKLLDSIAKLQDKYLNANTEELNARYNELSKQVQEMADKRGVRGSKAKQIVADEIKSEYDRLALVKAQKSLINQSLTEEQEDRLASLERDMGILDDWAYLERVRLPSKWNKNHEYDPEKDYVPHEILFDLNRGEEFANNYPYVWAYRTTRGPSMGKAITPYTSQVLGQTIYGVAGSPKNLGKRRSENYANGKLANAFLSAEITTQALRKQKDAIKKARAQNLLGGSRAQSTSDFRFEYVFDYILHFMDLQAIGSKGQTYTKVPEAVPMLASVGYEVNCSLMPFGRGVREVTEDTPNAVQLNDGRWVVLNCSTVTGMHIDDALKFAQTYDNVQPIMVGLNDDHIFACMRDDRITFIIPYHASGGTQARYETMMSELGEIIKADDRQNYEDFQNDTALPNATEEQVRRRELRKMILTGKISGASESDMELIRNSKYLSDLYNRFYVEGVDADCYKTFLSASQASQIFPFEYWDKTTTFDTADENGRRFWEYCNELGMKPRFAQFGGTDGSEHGYWKMLIDRRMYNNDGTYHVQQAINMSNFNTDYLYRGKMEEGLVQPSKQYKKTDVINGERVELAKHIGDKVIERINNDTRYSLEDDDDYGYHYGAKDIDYNHKSETLWRRPGRSTGAFGTGIYLFGDGRLNEPLFTGKGTEHKVDLSNYNLFKPKTNRDGFKLHDFFKELDDNYSYTGVQTTEEYSKKLSAIRRDLRNFDGDNTTLEAPMTPGQVEEFRNRLLELENEYDVDKLIDNATSREGQTDAWELEYEIGKMNEGYSKGWKNVRNIMRMYEQIPDMAIVLGTSTEELRNIVNNAMESARADSEQPDFRGGNYDSVGTRVMKALGYDGIDVRHLDQLDNSRYGSVVYDLKPETVRYSLAENSETLIPDDILAQWDEDSLAEVDSINRQAYFDRHPNELGTVDIKDMMKDIYRNVANRMPIYTKRQQEAFERYDRYDRSLVRSGEMATLDQMEADVRDMIKRDRIKDINKNGFIQEEADAVEEFNKQINEEIDNIVGRPTTVEDAEELDNVARILDAPPQMESETGKQVARRFGNLLVHELIDHGDEVYRVAREAGNMNIYAKYDYAQNVDNIVGRMFNNQRVDLQTGEVIGRGFEEIFAPIRDSGLAREFGTYMYHLLNIDRMTLDERLGTDLHHYETKPVFSELITARMSQDFVSQMEAEHPQFKQWAEAVYEYENAELDMLVRGGRLSQEQVNHMRTMYPHYVPISRDMSLEPYVNDEQVVSSNRAVKRATGGTANINPLEFAMKKHSRDVYSTILWNDLFNDLADVYGRPGAENEVGTDYGIDDLDRGAVNPAEGYNQATLVAYRDGERFVVPISQELYNSLMPRKFLPDIPFVHGIDEVRRNLITGWNPIFAFTNAMKDFQDAQFNTKFNPVRYNSAYLKAWNEIRTNGRLYQMYMNLGGEHNSYFRNEEGARDRAPWFLKKVIEANEKVETAPRLAEFICSLESGATTAEAMYNASDITTNFKRGGRTAKYLNRNGFMFLNASIQGFDKQVRNITEAKDKEGWKGVAKYMAKLTVLNAIPLAILNGLVWDDDDDYAELSDYIKRSYYIVGKYGDGKFIRIPKGRVASFIQTVMENARTTDERKSMFDNFVSDIVDDLESFVSNVAPNNPIDNNIVAPLIQASTNKAWYGDDIVPTRLQDERPSEQYDDSTDALSRAIGQFSRKVADETGSSLFELSPYKIHYVLDQYTGAVGDIGLPMLTPRAENRIDNQLLSGFANPLLDKFTTDSTLKNQRVTDFYAMKEELNKLASSSEATEEQILASKFMNSVSGEMSQLYKDKRAIQSDTSMPNSEKFDEARNIQEQIVELAKKGLTGYDQIDIRGDNATVGDTEYKKSSGGDWAKTKTRDFSQYYSTYGLDDEKQSQFKSAMEVTSKKDENGKTIRNSEALATRKALEDMGEYENVLKYIEENGLDYKDFDLNKTVVGYDESKFNDKYNAVYETEEASAEPKSTSYTPRQNTSQNGSNDSEEDFFSTLLNIINAPVSTSRSGLSANVAQVFKEGRQRSKSIRSNRDDLRKAIAKAKRKYNL